MHTSNLELTSRCWIVIERITGISIDLGIFTVSRLNSDENNCNYGYFDQQKSSIGNILPWYWFLIQIFLSLPQYDEGLHGYMDSGSAAAAMYDPHAGHRPGLQGLPPHHSPHMSHGTAHSVHGYHSGAPSHVSPVANHVMGSIPEVHKRDKDAIYG